MDYQHLLYSAAKRVATLTLNRPDKRNALNYNLVAELKDALLQAEKNPEVKVIVIKGAGKAFSAGADLAYLQRLQNMSPEENLADSAHLMELFLRIYKHRKPIIAQIEGHAIAGGCGLATVCDFSFAVPEAKFGYTEVRIGFIPALVMVFLLRKLGEAHARELLLTGELLSAERAEHIGLINRVVEADAMDEHVASFAEMLASKNSGGSMEITKRMIADVQNMPLEDALTFAAKMNAHVRGTAECQRGIAAFLNKEKLEW